MREIIAKIDRPMSLQNFIKRTFPAIPPAIMRKAMDNRDVRRAGKRLYADELIYPDDQLTLYIDDKYLESEEAPGFLGANNLAGRDIMEILIAGNDERVLLTSRFDNLGKGASGAAVQCMNIALGLDEATGLVI